MNVMRSGKSIWLLSTCVLSGLTGCATSTNTSTMGQGQPTAELALQRLQSDFHRASATGDYELMHSLWADYAVWSNPSVTLIGPTEIADWFAAGPGWGTRAALSPTYKSSSRIQGNRADFEFECVLVDMGGLDPLTTSLSSLPPGSQNPNVEIVQHSTASCTATKQHGEWVFQSFSGSGGPILP